MRAVIYARYSSDLQRDASIEDQVRSCRARIEAEGWALAATYTDHALSGASHLRPGYQQLLADARAGAFDAVVAEALDRLSRDQEHVAGFYKQLTFAGVKIITLAEGEIGELHVGLKGTMNALYIKDLAHKTRRGLEGRVRQGRSGGGLPYGYRVVRRIDASGAPVRGEREIDEDQAEAIRRIFSEFAAGKSPRAIARDLNVDGIAGPKSRSWVDTTIRGHPARLCGILRNEIYIGRLIWNRQHFAKDPTTGRRVTRINPKDKWIVQDVPALRIVSQDLWDRVQARFEQLSQSPAVKHLKASKFWEKRRPRHLLSGLVKCGVCGGDYAPSGRHYLSCSSARRKGTCSNRKGIARSRLEDLVLTALKHHLMEPDLVKEFIREFHAEVNRQRHRAESLTAAKQRELQETQRKLERLIDAIAEGYRSPDLQARLDQLGAGKARLERELSLTQIPLPRLHPNLAGIYRQKVERLQEALQVPATHEEALDILRGLIEKLIVRPTNNGCEVELIGEIANMVVLPVGPQALKRDQFRSSVKVVAGEGLEPPTLGL